MPSSSRSPRHKSGPVVCFVLLALLFVLAASPTASAQTDPYGVNVRADRVTASTEGSCVPFSAVVENTGVSPIPQQHTIELQFGAPGAGWRLEAPAERTLRLAPDAEATVDFRVCPTGAAAGDEATVTLAAVVTDDFRDPPARDSATFSVEMQESGAFGLDLPDAALYAALVLVAALLGVVLLTRRRSGAGVAISCPEPAKEVLPNRGTSFPIRIRNEGRERDVVSLTTSPVPRGWDTFLPLVDVPLEPREEQTVWLSVKSPADAQPGDRLVVKVIARSANGGAEQAEIDTLVTVREPDAPPRQRGSVHEETPLEAEPDDEERSVYGAEDDDPEPTGNGAPKGSGATGKTRAVAVKRRKD